jgi:hypothetical protein
MNWKLWLQGLASSLASAAITVLTALIVLPQCPAGWQLFIIAVGPFLINFFSYIKQTPIPICKTLLTACLALSLISCATLQQKWEKATDDERARIIVSQTQKSLKLTLLSAQTFVATNPKYQPEWKTKVLPMFETVNNILGDLIKKGQAGEKLTYLSVISAIGGRVTDIITIINGWGVKTADFSFLKCG